MEPVAVRREDTNELIGYVCGRCAHPEVAQTMGGTWVVEHSLQLAEACCRCRDCDTPLSSRKGLFRGLCCDACEAKREAENAIRLAECKIDYAARDAENMGALAQSKDAQLAAILLREMKDWSEAQWCAGWLIDLEYLLWRDRPENASFRAMGLSCGGWWSHDHKGERFVLMPEWLEMAKARGDLG